MSGPREQIIYIICVQPHPEKNGKSDYLATVDVDPKSSTYGQVITMFHFLEKYKKMLSISFLKIFLIEIKFR